MSYTIYGKVNYIGRNTACSGVVGGGYVHPYFKQVDSGSSPSKWSNTPYVIDFVNEGYYSFDIEDQDLLDVTGNYKKGADKFYIAYFWSHYNNTDDKDSSIITYAAFVNHVLEVGIDTTEINLTLLPTRVPIIDFHSFPDSDLLTRHQYTMSETSHCDYTWETPISCDALYRTSVAQKYTYDLVTIFDSYIPINTLYYWDEASVRSVVNSSSDDYTFNAAGDYDLQMIVRTGWNTQAILNKTVRVKYNVPNVDFHWTPTLTNSWDGPKLKGQELITFHNDTSDLDNRSEPTYTYDWVIEDVLYGGGDNTTTHNNVAHNYTPTHSFQSPGAKSITLTCNWFDGFDNLQETTVKQITIHVYTITPRFDWDFIPINRSQDVTFDTISTSGDTHQINNYYWTLEDNYPAPAQDLYTFSTGDSSKFGDESPDNTQSVDNTTTLSGILHDTVVKNFHSTDSKDIYLDITYYNGWVNVTKDITKVLTPSKYTLTPVIDADDFTPKGRHQLVTYSNDTVDNSNLQYDVDWAINDFYIACNLDNPTPGTEYDNTTTYSGVVPNFQPTHYYQNTSANDVDLVIRYDDGWQRQQKYVTTQTEPIVFSPPTPNFIWLPSVPISRDITVTFLDSTIDTENRHRHSDWEISDYYELYNPNNPNYGNSNTDNYTTYSGVATSFEPGHNFQSNVNHNILLRYYYDDGFCEQFVEDTDTVTTTEYSIIPSFVMSPDENNQYGENPITFTNTTTDADNRALDVDWLWNDRDGLNGNTDHLTERNEEPVDTVQEFTWQYPSRRPLSCTIPGFTNVNKDIDMEVRYDNGWNDQSFSSTSDTSEAKPYEVSSFITFINTADGASIIWGQEIISFTHNVTDVWMAIISGTSDWVIEDAYVDNNDNTQYVNDEDTTYKPEHSFQSSATRNVDVTFDFDDGWFNIYQHNKDIDIDVNTYLVPLLDFTWNPINPTIVDLVEFTQDHTDNRVRGNIDHVDVDFYDDGVDMTVSGTEIFYYNFTPKQDNIPITLSGTYWDGFEFQVTDITKYMDMNNIPPSSTYDTTESGICIPGYTFTATSSDLDDPDENLSYDWTLEMYNVALTDWAIVGTGEDQVFNYPFQYQGSYRLTLKTTDIEGDYTTTQDTFDITFAECTTSGGGGECTSYGYIQLEAEWQLISVPVEFGYWDSATQKHIHDETTEAKFKSYILDQITDKYGSGVIEVANTFLGDVQAYYSYVVGSTPESSPHNFKLINNDSGYLEVTGMWVKVVGPDAPYLISWGDV